MNIPMQPSLAPQRAMWTDAHIARFWDYESQRADLSRYFASQVGCAVAWLAARADLLHGTVLDYGCGAGHLIPHLLKAQARVQAIDFSAQSVATVNERFRNSHNWEGAIHARTLPTTLSSGQYDLIFCLETLEHLRNDTLEEVLAELHRLLKVGGALIVTTPFNEDLQQQFIYCPFCDVEFHRWQHQRSFDETTAKEVLETQGFDVKFCQQLDFLRLLGRCRFPVPGPRGKISITLLKYWLTGRFSAALDWCLPRPWVRSGLLCGALNRGANLCAIAIKR